ncbi:DUF1905 domain-containing protein [Leifsonia sp. H3M29-4]|jgi:hypothetical protein|uniref:DUF1905 domain-containing protein n=1 Tax=Salinibacterium metalliresistens TaxID=3031321 RepID=UPI0023DC5018|nr:DUF1905 domain-containing protein [Salinibacterium metalliresistens]MDF1480410.1 DUF1905 domain-containing protein [Salinibacterium metalliresistens]
MANYTFAAPLWRWENRRDNWFFVTLPAEVSADLEGVPRRPQGFDGVKVMVTLGGSTWRTAAFQDSTKNGLFVLPIKKSVRVAEAIADDATVQVTVRLL